MLRFNADSFCRISSILSQSWVLLNRVGSSNDVVRALGESMGELQRECEALGLSLTRVALVNFRENLDTLDRHPGAISRVLAEVQSRLVDELSERLFLFVPPDKRRYYDGHDFSPAVEEAFRPASSDMIEAGKCLALGRHTACVFHLMRVAEVGLHALGAHVEVRAMETGKPNWGPIIQQLDKELKTEGSTRRFNADERAFLADASAHVHAVKTAWRNEVMHVERTYEEEQAVEIYNATKGLMRHLSTRLRSAP